MGWADNKYAQSSDLFSYLPLKGGEKLMATFRSETTPRQDRLQQRQYCPLAVAVSSFSFNAEKPLIFSSGSGSKKLLSFYGYDGSADDNKSEKAYITASGEARFKKVYSSGKELATKEYVDANAGGGGGGAVARTGSSQSPSLVKGELYLRTTDNALLIGI